MLCKSPWYCGHISITYEFMRAVIGTINSKTFKNVQKSSKKFKKNFFPKKFITFYLFKMCWWEENMLEKSFQSTFFTKNLYPFSNRTIPFCYMKKGYYIRVIKHFHEQILGCAEISGLKNFLGENIMKSSLIPLTGVSISILLLDLW